MNGNHMNMPNILMIVAATLVALMAAKRFSRGRSARWSARIGAAVVLIPVFVLLLMGRQAGHPSPAPIVRVESTQSVHECEDLDQSEGIVAAATSPKFAGSTATSRESRITIETPHESGSRMTRLVERLSSHSQSDLRRMLYGGAALAALLGLTFLFLDAGRRGRYAWWIRVSSLSLFVGLCMLIWQAGPMLSSPMD